MIFIVSLIKYMRPRERWAGDENHCAGGGTGSPSHQQIVAQIAATWVESSRTLLPVIGLSEFIDTINLPLIVSSRERGRQRVRSPVSIHTYVIKLIT
jgi:hypothetical protein